MIIRNRELVEKIIGMCVDLFASIIQYELGIINLGVFEIYYEIVPYLPGDINPFNCAELVKYPLEYIRKDIIRYNEFNIIFQSGVIIGEINYFNNGIITMKELINTVVRIISHEYRHIFQNINGCENCIIPPNYYENKKEYNLDENEKDAEEFSKHFMIVYRDIINNFILQCERDNTLKILNYEGFINPIYFMEDK